jgi:hypothetical protein
MEEQFNVHNIVGSLIFFWEAEGDTSLHISFIRGHFSDIMYQDDFMALPHAVLERIILSDELDASRLEAASSEVPAKTCLLYG